MPYNTSAIPPRKEPTGQNQLPLSRVKKIIAQDPDVNMCSNNAVFVITLAAELFIQHLADEAHTQTKLERKPRRNIQYKDVANAVSHQDHLEFLEDIVPKTVPMKKVKAIATATQARLRGEKTTDDAPLTTQNGNSKAFAGNGDSSRLDEDPNDQLELEMRQAARSDRDKDISMTG
ncbi:histone-fold-containing protein [Stachybotrys elegans]|uniref:Histone-fold-containing protein n=1 Tax=Stachybotrys elegans TaxID=80388 RepID=A0A8K0T4M7_9HYPO|nr:histone-fold-containing protein [Stachybotrys elegans]